MDDNELPRQEDGSSSFDDVLGWQPEDEDIEASDIPDMPREDEEENRTIPKRSGLRMADKDSRRPSHEIPIKDMRRENRDKKTSDSRSARSRSSRRKKRRNYRLMLCIAALAAMVFDLLFLSLFLGQRSKSKELKKQVDDLTMEKTTLTNQLSNMSQEVETLRQGVMDSLPEPKTAQTDNLPDLIPQLTDALYVIHVGDGYDYIKVPSGYLTDSLNNYKDAQGYSNLDGDTPNCPYLVLYPDRVIGLAEGDVGFVSTERSATGTHSALPAGFTSFVAAFFA